MASADNAAQPVTTPTTSESARESAYARYQAAYTAALDFFAGHNPRELVARYGSPLYLYNEPLLRARCRELLALSDHPGFGVAFSAKANANPALLRIIREEGLHADSMSPGELALTRKAGFTREETAYVCNNVSPEEMLEAARMSSVVSLDSLSQLETFGRTVSQNLPGSRVMLRLNPGVGAGHHQKVITAGKETKFGIDPDDVPQALGLCHKYGLRLAGLNQHVGSLFMDAVPFMRAVRWLLDAARALPCFNTLEIIDFGGGFGIPYHKYDRQARLDMSALGAEFNALLHAWSRDNDYQGRFVVEPGRYAVAECGLLLGSVHAVKNNGDKRYVGTDLGFNVLARPVMYSAYHDLEIYPATPAKAPRLMEQTVVGNICESGDIIAAARLLPEIRPGDVLGVLDAGAYGYSMASSYNQRVRPAEVLIGSDGVDRVIRRRETIEDLLRLLV